MPCLAHECHPSLPAANRCKSLSCLVRETYAHCHVPCLSIHAAGWSSGDDALDTKQVMILTEMGNREMRKRSSRCSVDSPTLSGAFVWSFTPLHPTSSIEKVWCTEEKPAVSDGDGDVESEAFISVKSFFTRSTSRAATVASSAAMNPPATWEGLLCRRPAAAQHACRLVEMAQAEQQQQQQPRRQA